MYNNHNSLHKERCRKVIYNLARTYKAGKANNGKEKRVNVFTLPSTNFLLEKQLNDLGTVKLYCSEHDKDLYIKGKQVKKTLSIDNSNFSYYLGDIFDILSNPFQVKHIVWLDLCCSLQISIINKLISLIQNIKIDKTAYIAITVMAKREFHSKEIQSFYKCKSLKEFREEKFPKVLSDFANMANRELKLIDKYYYTDTAPMLMLTFKLTEK